MKQFSLDEYLANPARKVVTRDGRPVKIHCTNFGSGQHIVAEIEGTNRSESFTKDGSFYYGDHPSIYDLFFAPEKYISWINIYNSSKFSTDTRIFSSEEEAKKEGKKWKDYVTTIKIEWEI